MKNRRYRRGLLAALLVLSLFSMSSCFLSRLSTSGVTRSEVQQMLNNSMLGDVTVQGGDNYNVTIDGVPQDNAAAGKALLSAVSIRCVFQTSSLGIISGQEKMSAGSGVIYKLDKNKGDAYIITNHHVVYYNDANTENKISNDIRLYLYGQESDAYAIPATYVGGSMNYDIAVLKVSGSRVLVESNAMAVSFADSDFVSVLDQAIAVGNPEALGISATLGYINVDSEYINMESTDGDSTIQMRVMRMDTAVNSGNSGGGLFNNKGELIGVVNAKLASSENMSYAIPSNLVRYVAENILYYCNGTVYENVYKCMLGVTIRPIKLYTVYDSESGKVLKREVVCIEKIETGGVANGLLKVGDVINTITIDGTSYEANRMYMITETMLNARVGSTVVINITRDNRVMDITVPITQKSLQIVK